MTELFIENQRLDLTGDISALLTFAIDDIQNPASKNTTFSKTIVLPGTSNNNKVLGHIFDVTKSTIYNSAQPNVLVNYNAAKSARCVMFQDNMQVFKGVLRVMEIIEDRNSIEYEVAVFGELTGFVGALGNKRLEDLSFATTIDNYDLNYTLDSITGSWAHIGAGDGIYYPLIDYGNYSVDKHNWDIRTFRPALFVFDYITKIIEQSGYRYDAPIFETTRFKRLIVPHNQKVLTRLNNRIALGEHSTNQDMLTAPKIKYPSFAGSFTPNSTFDEFTYTGSPMSVQIDINFKGYVRAVDFQIVFIKNGVVKDVLAEGGSVFGGPLDTSYRDYLSTPLNTGDVISIKAIVNTTGFSPEFTLSNSTFKLYSDNEVQVPVGIGDQLNITDIIPKGVMQRDFFSSILKLFNLYVTEDRFDERKLIITPYIDFYNYDPSTFLDWTYKLDRDRPKRIKPMSELNARYYEFKYKDDSDYYNDLYKKRYNETYGSRIYDSEYEFAGEKATVDLIFAATPLVGYQGEDKVYSTILKRTGTGTVTEENIDSVIRILQVKNVTGVSNWNIKNGSTVLGTYSSYGYAGHLDDPDAPADDLNFGVTKELFFELVSGALNVNNWNLYYSSQYAEITDPDSKLLTATFYLTPKDIYNLDFSRLIYIDGALWRIKKIEDYNCSNADTCKVTLLKVINTEYSGSSASGFPYALPITF